MDFRRTVPQFHLRLPGPLTDGESRNGLNRISSWTRAYAGETVFLSHVFLAYILGYPSPITPVFPVKAGIQKWSQRISSRTPAYAGKTVFLSHIFLVYILGYPSATTPVFPAKAGIQKWSQPHQFQDTRLRG